MTTPIKTKMTRQQRKEAGITWRQQRIRMLKLDKRGDNYIRFTPNFGFSIPFLPKGGHRRRLRFARHHGLQIVEWRRPRWFVAKQILGTSKVKGELFTNGG
jgi:hypothetical protein